MVTGGDDATVAVWDVETGAKRLLINNAHGKEEITCMALDNSQQRLITAARNGTIKVCLLKQNRAALVTKFL